MMLQFMSIFLEDSTESWDDLVNFLYDAGQRWPTWSTLEQRKG